MSAPINETHKGGVVQVVQAPGQRFGILPRSIPEDLRLPPDARLVACWLATQQEGFQVVVSALSAKLGLGKEKWQRIARQLEAAGYLLRSCSPSGPGGRWVWTTLFFSDASASTGGGLTGAGFPGSGAPGAGRDGYIREQGKENKEPKKREGGASAPPRAARRRASLPGGTQFEIDHKTGIHHDPKNRRDADAMRQIAEHPAASVRAAAREVAALDDQGRAFPSSVLRHLLRAQGRAQADVPAWARGAAGRPRGGGLIVDGEATWTD